MADLMPILFSGETLEMEMALLTGVSWGDIVLSADVGRRDSALADYSARLAHLQQMKSERTAGRWRVGAELLQMRQELEEVGCDFCHFCDRALPLALRSFNLLDNHLCCQNCYDSANAEHRLHYYEDEPDDDYCDYGSVQDDFTVDPYRALCHCGDYKCEYDCGVQRCGMCIDVCRCHSDFY